MEIKVGYLVGYDYEMLKQSLPTLYAGADKIVLAIDKNRKTFAGEAFEIEPSFFDWLKQFDTKNKIQVYEDEFFKPSSNNYETENRTRNLLAAQLGEGGWHLQVDVDEYFANFDHLVSELRKMEPEVSGKKVTVLAYWSSIFKANEEGYFIVSNPESFALATNNPVYTAHRYNDVDNERHDINHLVLHQSWGRTELDLKTKLANWGHREDFDVESYFRFWKSLNADNYQFIKDFHPMEPYRWNALKFIKAKSIKEVLQKMEFRIKDTPKEKWAPLRKWLPPVIYNRLPRPVSNNVHK